MTCQYLFSGKNICFYIFEMLSVKIESAVSAARNK